MNTTAVLSQILGTIFTVLGVSMLLNKKGMMSVMEELTSNKVFMWLGGLVALIMGAVIIALNDLWTSGTTLLITILGWLALAKGVALTVFPTKSISFYKKMNKDTTFMLGGLVVLVLGLIMLF